jgi:hypothetical protein
MSARSQITEHAADRPGNGASRTWSRTIGGQAYSFTAVTMPSGERRYFASRFNGYPGGARFACAWDQAAEMTFRTDGTVRNRRFAPRTDHYWTRASQPARSRARTAR